MKSLKSFILKVRSDRDWSQRRLAEILEVNHNAIAQAEKGDSHFPQKVLARLSARVLTREEKDVLSKILQTCFIDPILNGEDSI